MDPAKSKRMCTNLESLPRDTCGKLVDLSQLFLRLKLGTQGRDSWKGSRGCVW